MQKPFNLNLDTDYNTKKLNQVIDLLAIHKNNPQRYPFLLESVANGDNNCDYSILFAFPQSQITLSELNHLKAEGVESNCTQFISGLNRWFEKEKISVSENIKRQFPFYGGWFIYLGYELAEEIEPVLRLPKTDSSKNSGTNLPIAMATRIPAAIIVNKKNNETWIISEPGYPHLIEEINADIQIDKKNNAVLLKQINFVEEAPERYINAVNKIKKYIIEGDVFQVNVSRKWVIGLDDNSTPADVYSQLRKSNPAPFAGLATFSSKAQLSHEGDSKENQANDSIAVISSSPERLVSVKSGVVETRPIAGTRPRQRTESGEIDKIADEKLREELIRHPKERAEHVMLIDLERNDLGRICKPGSINVDELMGLESYEHVHHIVSNVKGELADNILPGDVIKAVFPGGTITGCPKVRCMEIIAELEAAPRQAYTGSMGYLNLDGDMDLNILIRTIIQSGDQLHIRAGAGIVAYSDPEKELQETRIKAKGMLKVISEIE